MKKQTLLSNTDLCRSLGLVQKRQPAREMRRGRACNLCGQNFSPRHRFHRFCRKCRSNDESYLFSEWLG